MEVWVADERVCLARLQAVWRRWTAQALEENVLVSMLKLLNEDILIVEIFSTKVGITGGGLHLGNVFFDRQKRYIEGSSSRPYVIAAV